MRQDEPTPEVGSRREGDRLLGQAGRQGGRCLAVLVTTAVAIAAAETALPAVLGRAVDAIVGHASQSWLSWAGALIAVLVLCDVADDLAAGSATASSTAWLRRSVLWHLLALGTRAERFGP